MLVCLGPFVSFQPRIRRTRFSTFEGAFVPSVSVELDNNRIYKVLKVGGRGKTLYFVVYETENVDFYKPYLARIPERYEEIESLGVPRCPRCGSYRVDVDSDEMLCLDCRNEFWSFEVVWKPRELPPDREVLQGEGIFFPENVVYEYEAPSGHLKVVKLKKLGESFTKLGNVEVKCEEVVGCIDESHWDDEPRRHGFGVYKVFTAKDFKKAISVKVRDLTKEEMVGLGRDKDVDAFTKLSIVKILKDPQLVIDFNLHEDLPWSTLEALLEGMEDLKSKVKELHIKSQIDKMRNELKNGRLWPAYTIAVELKNLGYEDDETKSVIERYRKEEEEERRKWEEERKRREEEEERRREEEKRKLEERLRKEFNGLPVAIENGNGKLMVKLAKLVDKATFNKYVETCKKLNLTFDAKTKAWFKRL